MCIIKLTICDKHEPNSTQIFKMETTRSKHQTFVTFVSWYFLLELTYIEDW